MLSPIPGTTLDTKCRVIDGSITPLEHVGSWPTLVGAAPAIAVGLDMGGMFRDDHGVYTWRGGIEWRGPFTTIDAAQAEADRWLAQLMIRA